MPSATTNQIESRLGESLRRLSESVGSPLINVEDLTPLRSARSPRGAFRLKFQDGTCLKGRRFASPSHARVAADILRTLDMPAFPSVIAQAADAMLEEWIEGESLEAHQFDDAAIREIGVTLARLHQRPHAIDCEGLELLDAATWLRRIQENLQSLANSDLLPTDRAAHIEKIASDCLPSNAEIGIVHRDLRPENLLLDRNGRIRWVDSGSMRIGAVDEDLARVEHRWPMNRDQREAFMNGYQSIRDSTAYFESHLFWLIAVLTNSARVRVNGDRLQARELVGQLERELQRAGKNAAAHSANPKMSNAAHARFDIRGLSVTISSNAAAPVNWLDEFFGPWSIGTDAEQSAPAHRHINVAINSAAYQSQASRGPVQGGVEIECFTLDGRTENHCVWMEDADRRIIHDEKAELFYEVQRKGSSIAITARADHRNMRVALMRLVRELVTIHAASQGDLLLHAAAVCASGGVLFAGPKQAGKTSMLLNALNQPDVNFVSNDRVLVQRDDSGWHIHGMPTIVRIRPESLRHLPSPREADWARTFPYMLSPTESCMDPAGTIRASCFSLSPVEFCRWRGVMFSPHAKLRAILFPRPAENVEAFELTAMDPEEAAARLQGCLFANRQPAHPMAFAPEPDGTEIPITPDLRDLTRSCACIDCRLGPQAYRNPNVWAAIADRFVAV